MISAASRHQDSSENPAGLVDAVPSATSSALGQHGGTMQAEAGRLRSYHPTHV